MAVEGPVRLRAAKACKRCNQRRVKCDALEKGTPCSRCKASDVRPSDCVLIQSRRGTYARKKAKFDHPRKDHTTQIDAEAATINVVPASNDGRDGPSGHTPDSPSSSRYAGVDHASHQLRRSSTSLSETDNQPPPPPPAPTVHEERDHPSTAPISHETPATTVSSVPTGIDGTSPESGLSDSSATSYREISWAAMLDHFLESRRDKKNMIDKCSITYLGESFPLSMVMEDFKENGKLRLHHPGPPLLESQVMQIEKPSETLHPGHMLPEDIAFLNAKEAFDHPSQEILDALIGSFMDRVYPLYPIVNRQEFMQQYKAKKIAWILLHALCFASATFCPLAILHRAGFAGRKQARFSFYRKAKALFDMGYEANKITILQSVILMTMWGGGPNNYWNFYSWIGTGVTIAEAMGIHRSMAGTNMNPQDRSLLKRLWWVLVVRDASCGTLVGRPFRIDMTHSDTEMLTMEDFEYDMRDPDFAKHPLRNTYGLYQIAISELAIILREIVSFRFCIDRPHVKASTISNLDERLQSWRKSLPMELSFSDNAVNLSVFSSSLSIQYNHHLILAHLGRVDLNSNIGTSETGSVVSKSDQHIPEIAAQRISSLACTIITKANPLIMPHETFQGIFLAQVVFYTQMKSPQTLMAQLGRTALVSCQMAWADIREAWDPAPWIMKLFDNLVSNLNQESSLDSEVDITMNSFHALEHPTAVSLLDPNAVAGYEMSWSTHPMLSTFFDDGSAFQTPPDFVMPPYFGATDSVGLLQ
ncbi:hypothetical protein NA57DRAFT_78876 [Rhizodiscina lignyota]|uniref:Zn(2)-C6 fungal-type domain-containing protein n=1 Tax=Rhizodiscina lignyota TaxID=1504668 RepID=A0A9P4I8V0_9PEZI|nr:hypothetical protein NA57DRAFT_78876 [Rhizodiscina lignyota]